MSGLFDELNQNLEELETETEVETVEPETVVEAEEEVQEPQVVDTPVVETKNETHHVPINALLDERERRQKSEADKAALQARLDQYERANQAARYVPDVNQDPIGYIKYQDQVRQAERQEQAVMYSYMSSIQKRGEETTNAARQWAFEKAQSNPTFANALDHVTGGNCRRNERRVIETTNRGRYSDEWFNR